MDFCDDKPACDESDRCYQAVRKAYQELRARGVSDRVSFDSAVTVFRHYHPEVPARRAPYVIADWIG
jgi:hypothetical protein